MCKGKQKEILEAIVGFIQEHQYPPTIEEIGEMVGLSSKNTVYSHLEKMFERGILERDEIRRGARALRVPGYEFVRKGENIDVRNM